MLFVSAPADQRDLHVRDLGSGENASVLSFPQMREDQPLPVLRQRVHRAHALKDETTARFARLEQKMDLRVVAERLKVPDALHRPPDRLLVDDGRSPVIDLQTEPLHGKVLQDLSLDLSHEADRDFLLPLVVADGQHGFLLLKDAEIPVGPIGICPLRKQDLPGEDRNDETCIICLRSTEALPCIRVRQAADRDDASRFRLRECSEFFSRVQAYLCNFFIFLVRIRLLRAFIAPGNEILSAPRVRQHVADFETAACDLHPCKALPPVACDLEDAG